MQKEKENNLVIIDVFPIGRGARIESLSFFTAEKVCIGDVVTIHVRTKEVLAVVSKIREISDAKSELKNANFSLKKATKLSPQKVVTPEFLSAVEEIAEYYLSTPGAIFYCLTPTSLLKEKITRPADVKKITSKDRFEHFVIQTDDKERFANYKGVIREEFAKTCSVFFCVPTIKDAEVAMKELCKGIEKYTYVFHSDVPKKQILENWQNAISEKHSVLIIGTPQYMMIPRNDIKTLIVEKESSRGYKMNYRPFVDIRTASLIIGKHLKARVILGDSLLRIETIWKQKQGDFVELIPLKFRTLSTATHKIISPVKKPVDEIENKEAFSPLMQESIDLISEAKMQSERTFIMCSRKGIAPTTACEDCGATVLCEHCEAPVSLHKSTRGNFYLCHRCGERRDPDITCVTCGSWRLKMLGIGSEQIEEAVMDKFPDQKIFRLDKESAKTEKQAQKIIEQFYSSPGSVLVGTEMTLPYITEPIENIIIASIDSLFALPDFRIYERILHLLLSIRSKATRQIIAQTRNGDKHIFEYGLSGSMLDFYKEDIDDRKSLQYPPFSTIIKMTLTGEKRVIIKEMERIQAILGNDAVDVFPAFVSTKNKKTAMHAIIKIDGKDWPRSEYAEKIKALPASVDINVEPESLL